MRINPITSFAAGILLTTSILGGVFLSTDKEPVKVKEEDAKQEESLSEDEMKAILESKGYLVQLPEEEQTEEQAESEENQAENEGNTESQENADEEKQEEEQAEEKEEEPVEVVIKVESGMTSIDIGEKLREANLIDMDPFSFSKDIEARGRQHNLYPGTYTVNSSMSYDEMIDILFPLR